MAASFEEVNLFCAGQIHIELIEPSRFNLDCGLGLLCCRASSH